MADTKRLRQVVADYHAVHERARAATVGSTEFNAAMQTLRALREELRAAGVDPLASWRESTQRALELPTKEH